MCAPKSMAYDVALSRVTPMSATFLAIAPSSASRLATLEAPPTFANCSTACIASLPLFQTAAEVV